MIRYFSFVLLTFLFSCSSEEKVPDEVLPVSKMQSIMWDVLRADEIVEVEQLQKNDSTFNAVTRRIHLYDTIFNLQKITREDFKKSISFYQTRPDLLKIIFDSLQRKADTLSAIHQLQK